MKTLKLTLLIFAIAVMTCNNGYGQTVQSELFGVIDGMYVNEEIGNVYGTFTIHFTIKLSKQGYIENIHWNIPHYDLQNDGQEKVRIIDSGHDNGGFGWDFFNNLNAANEGYNLYYTNVTDGWLTPYMPSQMPSEGVYIEMSFAFAVKGKPYKLGSLILVHMNANGDITVDTVKTFAK
jgi:hypothetical protein